MYLINTRLLLSYQNDEYNKVTLNKGLFHFFYPAPSNDCHNLNLKYQSGVCSERDGSQNCSVLTILPAIR